ncbi:DUF748 domain-containing protein [Mangrovivirga cuniculi]
MDVNLLAFLKKYRTLTKIVISLSVFYVISILVIDFFGRNFIIKTVEEQTSRKVDVSSFRINPFTSSCAINEMVIYEKDEETPFLSIQNFTIDVSFFSLFRTDLHISEVSVNELKIYVIQGADDINIEDLKESMERSLSQMESKGIKYENIVVDKLIFNGGEAGYRNTLFNGEANFNHIKLAVEKSKKNSNKYFLSGSCQSVAGGNIELSGVFDQSSGDYNNRIIIDQFNINFLKPFIDKALYVENLTGKVNLNIFLGEILIRLFQKQAEWSIFMIFQLMEKIKWN